MLVKFFDPHPGEGGPSVPLPRKIKEVVDSYAGKEAHLADFLSELGQISGAAYWVQKDERYVSCRIAENGYTHQWRLISWEEVLN